jgi:hypothetical protein
LPVGARGFDTVQRVTSREASALRAAGCDFAIRYLWDQTKPDDLAACRASGLALSFVTYANNFDPQHALAHLARLAVPAGVAVALDLEGVDVKTAPPALIAKINTWAGVLARAGYVPALYVGAGALLTSEELTALAVVRYWRSCSRTLDRNGREAGPAVGWCMHQLHPPNLAIGGLVVDLDVIQNDYTGRAWPFWLP